jgi:Rrf2 family protein
MGMGSSFSVCVHILTLLAHMRDHYVSSEFIAGSINMNPAMVRKEVSKLRKNGLVESKEGKYGGVRLNRSPLRITMKEIMDAVKDPEHHLIPKYKNEPNSHCPIGNCIEERLEDLFSRVDAKVNQELSKVTLADFYRQFELS